MRSRIALLAAIVAPSLAAAQQPPVATVPWHGEVVGNGAFSMWANPANIAFNDGFSGTLQLDRDVDSQQTDVALATIFAAQSRDLAAGIGLAAASLDAGPDADGRDTRAGVTRFALAIGGPRAALGWARDFFASDDVRAIDNFATNQLALSVRPTNVFGFSTWIDNPATPRLAGRPVERRIGIGIGARTADGRIEGEVNWQAAPDAVGDGAVRALARTRFVDGITLASAVGFDRAQPVDAWFGSVSLEITIGPFTVAPGVALASDDAGDTVRSLLYASVDVPARPDLLGDRHRLLRIDISGSIPERGSRSAGAGHYPGMTDVYAMIDSMIREDRMGGVFIRSRGIDGGTTQLVELCTALDRLRESGRKVVVYFDAMNLRDLYLAAHADLVLVSPTVSVLETGITTTRVYIADLLDRIGIEAQFVRIGEHKSAPERFTQNAPSTQSTEALQAYLDVVWNELLAGIADGIDRGADETAAWLDEAPLNAEELVAAGIAHAAVYPDEVPRHLRAELGAAWSITSSSDGGEQQREWVDRDVIAVLHVDGAITSESMLFSTSTAAGPFVRACEALLDDSEVDGVLLRINSPGGSAVASDHMHRCLSRLADELPVVVSMAGVAASGGYYVAAIDAPIHASPTTLTGSIGIYAGTFALDDLLGRIGVNRVSESRGGPDSYFDGRAWSEQTQDRVYQSISDFYDRFLEIVADARDLTTDEVDAVARGRIWSGSAALEAGLVDHVDGLGGALDALRIEAGIPAHRGLTLRHYPIERFGVGTIVDNLVRAEAPVADLGAMFDVLGLAGLSGHIEQLAEFGTAEPVARLEWFFDETP